MPYMYLIGECNRHYAVHIISVVSTDIDTDSISVLANILLSDLAMLLDRFTRGT